MRRTSGRFLRALGAAVRTARVRRALTEAHLAERSGLSGQALKRFEVGRYNPTVLQLQAIAEALGLSLPELLKRAERRMTRQRP
jgi:transcriptional regulator with XRE-family HTH domain